MTNKIEIWEQGPAVMAALAPYYQEQAVSHIREAGALGAWFALLQAAGEAPRPLTTALVDEVLPYNAPDRRRQMLAEAVRDGFLSGNEATGYELSSRGRAVLEDFFTDALAAIGRIEALSAEEMNRLAAYLQRIIEATEALPEPPAKPNLARSRWTDTGEERPAMVAIDQYLTDLACFRDDAHIAAWKPYGVDGRTWEAFSFIWQEDANNAEALLEKRPNRGYTAAEYEDAYAALEEKGWIAHTEDGWQPTRRGRHIRQEAEEKTDSLFFSGWQALSATELTDMYRLLQRLDEHLRANAPLPGTG